LQGRQLKAARQEAAQQRIKSWKDVSLSWWLSPPLQAYLDGQVHAGHNTEAFRAVLSLLLVQPSDAASQ
jgi:hypothetical protein